MGKVFRLKIMVTLELSGRCALQIYFAYLLTVVRIRNQQLERIYCSQYTVLSL